MEGAPLWELAKKSMTPLHNSREFSAFLKQNERRADSKRLIDPNEYYLRLTVIICFAQLSSGKLELILFSICKIAYLFRLDMKKLVLIDICLLLACSVILPQILAFVPAGNAITVLVAVLYFFGGTSEKYLILPIILQNVGPATNFLSVLVLSLAKLEEPKGSIQAVIASDLVFLWWQNELDTLKMLGITVVMILSICALDRSFLPHKRRYSHLFELPTVQEYH